MRLVVAGEWRLTDEDPRRPGEIVVVDECGKGTPYRVEELELRDIFDIVQAIDDGVVTRQAVEALNAWAGDHFTVKLKG